MTKPESFDRYNGYEGGRPWSNIRWDFDGQTTQHVTMKLKTTTVELAERYSQQSPLRISREPRRPGTRLR